MKDEEYERMEDLFRQYQGNMEGLLKEVENFIRQYGNEPRLITLHGEIKNFLK